MKIEQKVSHREWDEVTLSPEEFIEFDKLYFGDEDSDDNDSPERYGISPTFNFENGSVYVDESWYMDEDGRVSTSSYSSGVMDFSISQDQYIEYFYQREKKLGQFVSITFTTEESMKNVLDHLAKTQSAKP